MYMIKVIYAVDEFADHTAPHENMVEERTKEFASYEEAVDFINSCTYVINQYDMDEEFELLLDKEEFTRLDKEYSEGPDANLEQIFQ